jgi:hypothetical protein
MVTFSLDQPFTRQDAEKFAGKEVAVMCQDAGLQHTYRGTLTVDTDAQIWVGDEMILNEFVRAVTEL